MCSKYINVRGTDYQDKAYSFIKNWTCSCHYSEKVDKVSSWLPLFQLPYLDDSMINSGTSYSITTEHGKQWQNNISQELFWWAAVYPCRALDGVESLKEVVWDFLRKGQWSGLLRKKLTAEAALAAVFPASFPPMTSPPWFTAANHWLQRHINHGCYIILGGGGGVVGNTEQWWHWRGSSFKGEYSL